MTGRAAPVHWPIRADRPADDTASRIGLFGGTFDPPHVGHLVTAVNVRHALDLDRRHPDGRQRPVAEGGQPARSRRPSTAWRWSRRRSPTSPGWRPGGSRSTSAGRATPPTRSRALADASTRRRAVHDRRRRRRGRADDAGSATRRSSPGRRMVVVDRPGEPVELPDDVDVDPRRGAPARGVEHRPAGPVHRRPAARLPRHRPVLEVIAERGLYRGNE